MVHLYVSALEPSSATNVGPVISLNNQYKSCRLQSRDTCLLLILYLNYQYELNVKSIYYITIVIQNTFYHNLNLVVINHQHSLHGVVII